MTILLFNSKYDQNRLLLLLLLLAYYYMNNKITI